MSSLTNVVCGACAVLLFHTFSLLFWILSHLSSRFHRSSWVWRTLWLSRPPPPPTSPHLPLPLPTTLAAHLFLTLFRLLQLPLSLSLPTPTTTPPSLKRSTTPSSSPTFRWLTSLRRNWVQWRGGQKLLSTKISRLHKQYPASSGSIWTKSHSSSTPRTMMLTVYPFAGNPWSPLPCYQKREGRREKKVKAL